MCDHIRCCGHTEELLPKAIFAEHAYAHYKVRNTEADGSRVSQTVVRHYFMIEMENRCDRIFFVYRLVPEVFESLASTEA